jgi:hypothetical protein
MSELERQVTVERTLARVDPSLRDELERIVEQDTKRPPSVTHVGGVFGCADERGLNALVATRPDGTGVLRVNDPALASRGLRQVAHIFAALAILAALATLTLEKSVVLIAAVTLALFALGLYAGISLDLRRRRRQVQRIADALESRVVRLRVELDERESDEVEAESKLRPARRGFVES